MGGLLEFASSVPDFRRTSRGNHRHRLSDIIILLIFARMSKCVARADIIEFGRHNLTRFRSMGMLENGVPSEATLFRIESGIEECKMADRMQAVAPLFCWFAPYGAEECVSFRSLRRVFIAGFRHIHSPYPVVGSSNFSDLHSEMISWLCHSSKTSILCLQRLPRLYVYSTIFNLTAITVEVGLLVRE